MNQKTILQIFLLIILLFITFLFFYLNKNEKNIITIKVEDDLRVEENSSNIIKNIKYNSYDAQGNRYEINALNGRVDLNNPELIFMTDVTATINFANKENILILSNYAKYNNITNDTSFTKSVKLNYIENKLYCEKLDLSFEENLVTLVDNVIYKNNLTTLMADKLEIDLITKDSKIFMNNESKKIKILKKY